MTKITTFGKVEKDALDQLERCAVIGGAPYGVLCADNHKGYSQPVGGAVAYRDFISPSGVGYDIACGNAAARTNILRTHLKKDLSKIMNEIFKEISFGIGRVNNEKVDHPVIDKIANAEFKPQRKLAQMAADQLGTVGSGNHYVDLFEDEEGYVWVGVHFGSRGLGHRTASGFLAMAQGAGFGEKIHEGEMDAPPTLLHIDSYIGQAYIEAMNLCGEYAYAGRDWVVDKVLSILGGKATKRVHNHHNFAWLEEHGGEKLWVIRKGCTPAYPGQEGFVGGSMGDISVILEGVDSEKSRDALYSTMHGAGRVMSRTQAAGKVRAINWRECNDRECDYRILAKEYQDGHSKCPEHPDAGFRKFYEERRIKEGKIDWDAAVQDLIARGIELRGGGADEAPGVYKNLQDVLDAHSGTIKVTHVLQPIGVAMAGRDVYDPFKD